VLQLIQEDATSKAFHLFRKWGRVGNDRIGNDKIERMSSKAAGINEFKRLFQEKTGNLFEQWVDHENFEKQPGKFHPLEIVRIDPSLFYSVNAFDTHVFGVMT